MTWKLLLHSYRMITNNLLVTLRITLMPLMLVVILLFGSNLIRFGHLTPLPEDMDNLQRLDSGSVFWAFLFIAVYVSVYTWVIVGWHRFILLGEVPNGWLPNWYGHQNFDYFVKGILIGLIFLIPMMVVGSILNSFGSVSLHRILSLVLYGFIFSFMYMKLGLVLPAAALGVPMKVGESWAATKDASMTILGLAAILTGMNIVVGLLEQILTGHGFMVFAALFLNLLRVIFPAACGVLWRDERVYTQES